MSDVRSTFTKVQDFERLLLSQEMECEEIKQFILSIPNYQIVEHTLSSVLIRREDVKNDYAIKLNQCAEQICDELLKLEFYAEVFNRLEKIKLHAILATIILMYHKDRIEDAKSEIVAMHSFIQSRLLPYDQMAELGARSKALMLDRNSDYANISKPLNRRKDLIRYYSYLYNVIPHATLDSLDLNLPSHQKVSHLLSL